jgi:hypothetical protein
MLFFWKSDAFACSSESFHGGGGVTSSIVLQLTFKMHFFFRPNEAYRKLDVLSRLHVVVEILLLAESKLKFSVSSLQPLAASCLNKIETSVSKIHYLARLWIFIMVKILIFLMTLRGLIQKFPD